MLICPSTGGKKDGVPSGGGAKSRAILIKSFQQAVVEAQVILPICLITALSCFREQRAMAGWREQMAAWSH